MLHSFFGWDKEKKGKKGFFSTNSQIAIKKTKKLIIEKEFNTRKVNKKFSAHFIQHDNKTMIEIDNDLISHHYCCELGLISLFYFREKFYPHLHQCKCVYSYATRKLNQRWLIVDHMLVATFIVSLLWV